MAELDNPASPSSTDVDTAQNAAEANNVQRAESNDVAYEWTDTYFKKSSRLPVDCPNADGTVFVWFRSWNHERITNEVKALQLLAKKTTIPVPELLDHGVLPDGRRFLVTKFIHGCRTLDAIYKLGCSLPAGQRHAQTEVKEAEVKEAEVKEAEVKEAEDTPCKVCAAKAHDNAIEFLNTIVFPQLSKLTSRERGIDGFVMPPQWMAPDIEPPWRGKKFFKTLPLQEPAYVFQHGDLGPQNLLVDPGTLQVKALIDWEYAGHYPPDQEMWAGKLDRKSYTARYNNVADTIARCLADEYLECYENWANKEQLQKLVDEGVLPDPALLAGEATRAKDP